MEELKGEVESLAQLSHPNVVQILGMGVWQDQGQRRREELGHGTRMVRVGPHRVAVQAEESGSRGRIPRAIYAN